MLLNLRNLTSLSADMQYIGRPTAKTGWKGSVLANPFVLGKDGSRDEVIAKYYKWLQDNWGDELIQKELRRLQAIGVENLKLVCWCAPEPCHGDVVLMAIRYLDEVDGKG